MNPTAPDSTAPQHRDLGQQARPGDGADPRRRAKLWLTTGVLTLALLAIVGWVTNTAFSSPYEMTRIRNSLLAEVGGDDDFQWTPNNPPPGYLQEDGTVPPVIDDAAAALFDSTPEPGDLWTRARAVGEHLMAGPGFGDDPIMSSTVDAYQTLMTERRGYCADYSQVYNGFAFAAGIPVREWGMSFDRFSGDGHAFNEVYDGRSAKWIFIDSFYSLYAVDVETQVPLSVIDFRDRLLAGESARSFEVKPLGPERFGFESPALATEYYRRGADQFFLWFGNNVFTYDDHPVIKYLSPKSRALEQLAAIALDLHPEIRIPLTDTNREEVRDLIRFRYIYLSAAAAAVVLGLVVLALLVKLWRRRGTELPLIA